MMRRTITILFFSLCIAGCRNHHKKIEPAVGSSGISPMASSDRPLRLIKDMDFQEAIKAVDYYRKAGKSDMVIKSIERAIAIGESNKLKNVRKELADLYMQKNEFEKAERHYRDYMMLYPGSAECIDTECGRIVASFKRTLAYRYDQQKTHETLTLIENFLDKYSEQQGALYTTRIKEVRDVERQCYEKLFDHDIDVANTMLRQYEYSSYKPTLIAAQKRLERARSDYLPYVPYKESELLAYEIGLAQLQNNQELIKQKQEELEKKFPQQAESIVSHKQRQKYAKI